MVGAGPAGGDLAAQLARAGIEVCLVDQLQDLTKSAFSSAGMPLAAMPRYGLPAELVGDRWDSWRLIGPGDQWRDWSATEPLGVVLQFGALRRWLADQCQSWGGTVRLGRRAVAISHEAEAVVTGQLDGSLPEGFAAAGGVVAYEPVWAIGTGRTPTEPDIAAIHAAIRANLVGRFGAAGQGLRILYGGSVKPGNATAILALPHVDGALVGGASLVAADFLAIAAAAG